MIDYRNSGDLAEGDRKLVQGGGCDAPAIQRVSDGGRAYLGDPREI